MLEGVKFASCMQAVIHDVIVISFKSEAVQFGFSVPALES